MSLTRFTLAMLAASGFALAGCGSGNGCDEHHPYACQKQKAKEEEQAAKREALEATRRQQQITARQEAVTREAEREGTPHQLAIAQGREQTRIERDQERNGSIDEQLAHEEAHRAIAREAEREQAEVHARSERERKEQELPPVALSLRPSARAYVCLIGDKGRKLIPGEELQPGITTQTYRARHFEITLGNSSVTMIVDRRRMSVPQSSQAIGYSLTKAEGRRPLPEGQLPTCGP
jgi:hypothetical protein